MWPYPAPPHDGAADHLYPGLKLPNFPLESTQGDTVFLGSTPGSFIVFVYPWTGRDGFSNPPGWDDVPGAHGSTAEAEGFRDLADKYQEKAIRIFGMSSQTINWHKELSERLKLPYPLLSDVNFLFADALKLPRFTIEGVNFLKRLTLVCSEGKLVHTVYPVHPPDRHAYDLLNAMEIYLS